MKAKKGISLIVLVITIIVIIILAAAVLLSINKNNPIENANKAVVENDKGEVQSAVTLLMGSVMADIQQSAKLDISGAGTGADFNITEVKIVTNETTPREIVLKDNKYAVKETDDTTSTVIKLTAENLDIDAGVLAKYQIDANGKVTVK